jgi:hypothetical protein
VHNYNERMNSWYAPIMIAFPITPFEQGIALNEITLNGKVF